MPSARRLAKIQLRTHWASANLLLRFSVHVTTLNILLTMAGARISASRKQAYPMPAESNGIESESTNHTVTVTKSMAAPGPHPLRYN